MTFMSIFMNGPIDASNTSEDKDPDSGSSGGCNTAGAAIVFMLPILLLGCRRK